jgi:hypothetical protein
MFHRKLLRCSFCKKNENEVAKLVAGPGVYICDTCVQMASRFMDADQNPGDPPSPPTTILRRLWIRAHKRFGNSTSRCASGEGALA